MILESRGLEFRYGNHIVLRDISLKLERGITAIIGPNAAGKSTLMRCLAGLRRAVGTVELDGVELASISHAKLARTICYLPQEFTSKAAITVFEMILLGRLQQLGLRVGDHDIEAVEQLLLDLDIQHLARRPIGELSGGQAQLAAIAQALAREPRILLLDEPTSNLDLRRQFEVCELLREMTEKRQLTTAIAIHDLNLAARFADKICVFSDGRLHDQGTPTAVLTEQMIDTIYGVQSRTEIDDAGGLSVIVIGKS